MKKFRLFNVLGAIALSVTVFFFVACDPTNPIGPEGPDPDDPTPDALVKPEITSSSLESVTENQAIFSVSFKANEKNTKLFLEHRLIGGNYQKLALSGGYTGVDVKKVTADFPELSVKTEYQVRLIAVNAAGSDTSITFHISTYIVRDYDNNPYHVIKIGNQYWLQENLKTSHYTDGTEIPNVVGDEDWVNQTGPAYCWYNNDPELGKIYGALYNRSTVTNEKVLITGFHVPSANEFTSLNNYLGETVAAGPKMKDSSGKYWEVDPWEAEHGIAAPNNESGFTALGSGTRYIIRGTNNAPFSRLKINCWLLTSTNEEYKTVFGVGEGLVGNWENWGYGIRLIKD